MEQDIMDMDLYKAYFGCLDSTEAIDLVRNSDMQFSSKHI